MNANLGSNKQSTRLYVFTGIFHESDAIHLNSQSCNQFTRLVKIVNNISKILSLIKKILHFKEIVILLCLKFGITSKTTTFIHF